MSAHDDMNIGAMLAEPVERLLDRHVDHATLAAAEAGQFPSALWRELQDTGATQAMVPEARGGAGLGWCDVLPLLRLLGRHAAPVPLGETLLAASVLARAGLAVPEGALAISTASYRLDAQGRLTGGEDLVAWAPQVQGIVVVALADGQPHVALVPADRWDMTAVQTHARMPSAAISAAEVEPALLAAVEFDLLGPLGLLPQLAVLRAAQIAGALEAVLQHTVEYANDRVQFGKPIGKLQAIQAHLAELAMQTAAAQVAVQFGCRHLDSGDSRQAVHGAAVAKQRSSKSATVATAAAHQVFGAIGVTDEHLLHHLTRRLWQWRAEGGSEFFWSEQLGRQAIAAGGDGLWPRLVEAAR